MRPLPSEIIAGIRRILKESIEPELTSGHARSRLEEVRAVLAQMDWDDFGFTLASRNRALAGVLEEIQAWRVADPARSTVIPDVAAALPGHDRLAAHQSCFEELAGSVVALVDPLGDWVTAHPEDSDAARLRKELLEAL
ncbi:hypothetical protein I0Q12_08345 [Rhodococcus sp. CX]|uniref:hypothetical protein n=1 Tax=Rhodococcus sp. CX TaxID=2789880 RepID=UPI0018CE6B62|nr:hypothetical protein [Rhodococcus sp. CX]MBH0119530.1 hypothetical protein [Rhodococcus sp. CX]